MRLACALALLIVTATAQDRPETVIRTTTRLVQIRMMAEDSNGNPVTDLRKEELQLQDNRKPQHIDSLFAEGAVSATATSAEAAAPSADPSAEQARDDYAMILVDWLNPGYADRLVVRAKVNKLLGSFQPRQMMAMYLMGHKSRLLHDFTADPAELLQSLANTEDEPEDPFDPSRPRGEDPRYPAWARLKREEKIASFNVKILDTVAILEKLADGLTRVPGRKSLIWVTNGFPIELDSLALDPDPMPGKPSEISYRENVEHAIDKLNRSNVALYTVDARGLQAGPPSKIIELAQNPSYGDVPTLRELSARTGGTSVSGRNDLDEAVRQALDDSKISYTLGFVVPSGAPAGLHRIQLRTTRPGVSLRYRESYQLDRQ